MLKVICLTLILQSHLVKCGLLGYGTGEGSCAAPPFRAYEVQWAYGCPHFAPCCSEFGFCRPLEEWDYGKFRDCNGVSNGTPLLPETIAAEEAAGPYEGKPAGEVGPPPDVIRAHHPEVKKPHHIPHHDPHALPHHPVHPPPHPHDIAHSPHPHPVPHPPVAHAAHAPHPAPIHPVHHGAHPHPPVHNAPHPPHPHLPPHPPVHHTAHSLHSAPHSPVHHGPHPHHPAIHHPVHHASHPPHPHPLGHPPVHHVTHDPAPHPHIPHHVQHNPHHLPHVAPEPHHPPHPVPEPFVHHPKPHHPPHTAPEHYHPSYVAPGPHQPSYVAPEPHPPSYAAPEPQHPSYVAPVIHKATDIVHKPLLPSYVAPELRQPVYGAPEPPHPPPYHAPEPPKSTYHTSVPQPPTFHVPSHPHHPPQHHPLHLHHSAHHPSPPHLVQHPPTHFSVHSPVHPTSALTHPLTHVSTIKHALTPAHPLNPKPAKLSHKPFVSFGSSSSVTAKEPTIVNTVELRKAAMEDKPVEKDKSSSPLSQETRKAKAFESENQFKTSTTNQIKPSVTAATVKVQEETTTEMILTSNDLQNGAFVSLSQEPITEVPSTSVTVPTTTAPIAPMGTIAALTNIFSTPAPIIFSTLTPSITPSKSTVEIKEAFTSFGQNNEISSSATDKKEDSQMTSLSTGAPRPVALQTTRQPKILQAVTPLVNIFASTPSPTFLPSPTILPNPTINLGSASTLQENPATDIRPSNNPVLTTQPTEINLGQPRPIVVQPSPPSSLSQLRIPTPQRQNSALAIPVAKKSQDTSQCQHPRGGGSYTCISFGVPHDPIFAFHTVQGDDGFFFGTGSGFPEHKIVNGPATIRRRRKLQKVLIEKELARIRKEKLMRAKKEMRESETNIHILRKINDKLPITSYQKKLLEMSESEKLFQKLNKSKNRSTNSVEAENKDIYQTNFVSDPMQEMKSAQKSVKKTVTTPKVQLYEYPVEETISYLTDSATTTPSEFSDQDLKTPPRRLYPTSYESLNESLITTQP